MKFQIGPDDVKRVALGAYELAASQQHSYMEPLFNTWQKQRRAGKSVAGSAEFAYEVGQVDVGVSYREARTGGQYLTYIIEGPYHELSSKEAVANPNYTLEETIEDHEPGSIMGELRTNFAERTYLTETRQVEKLTGQEALSQIIRDLGVGTLQLAALAGIITTE